MCGQSEGPFYQRLSEVSPTSPLVPFLFSPFYSYSHFYLLPQQSYYTFSARRRSSEKLPQYSYGYLIPSIFFPTPLSLYQDQPLSCPVYVSPCLDHIVFFPGHT